MRASATLGALSLKIGYAESVASGTANAFSQVEAVRRYIRNQAERHRHFSFQDEFRRMLERYQVAYDERYVWD